MRQGPTIEPSSRVGGGDAVAARGDNKGSNHSRQGNGGTAQVMDADGPALELLSWALMARESSMLCRRETRRGDLQRERPSRETVAEGERRKRRERERERIKRERMKRERVHRERMKTWTQRGSHVVDGIRKPSTSAGMLTWCHKLDIKKGRATIWT